MRASLLQRVRGKSTEVAGNLFIAGTRFLSNRKWIRTPHQHSDCVGEGAYRYRIQRDWAKVSGTGLAVQNCHEMVSDLNGLLYLLTDQPKNNVIVFDHAGEVQRTWTLNASGAHGLTHATDPSGREVLWICDPYASRVLNTSLNGHVLQTLPSPHDLKVYRPTQSYMPTQTAVAANGDIYVADGYGSQHVLQFDQKGRFIRLFGGKGHEESALDFAHGIAIDSRTPGAELLLVTSRKESCIKQYSLKGDYLGKINLPGGYPCRPVIREEELLIGLCWSGAHLKANSGFVVILDSSNRVCATLGGNAEFDAAGNLVKLYSDYSSFCHVHDVCPDADGNLHVCQWNAGKTFPVRLERLA